MKKIGFTDVMIISKSLFCEKRGHKIIPCRRGVSVLSRTGKEEEYIVHVGYCNECKKYIIMDHDYMEMIKIGSPICAIYKQE